MEQMTITAKIQIIAAEADKVLLDETMSVYRNACNYVSDYVFRTHDLKQFSLNKALYSTLRDGSLTVVSNFSLTKSLKTLIISMLLSFFIVKFVKINVLIWANVCYNGHRR